MTSFFSAFFSSGTEVFVSIIPSSHDSSFLTCTFSFLGDRFGDFALTVSLEALGDFGGGFSSSDSLEDDDDDDVDVDDGDDGGDGDGECVLGDDDDDDDNDDDDEELDDDDPDEDDEELDDDDESLSEDELDSSSFRFFFAGLLRSLVFSDFFLVESIMSFLFLSTGALLFPFFFSGLDSRKAAIFCGGCCIISSTRSSIICGSSSSCSIRVLTNCRMPSIMISSL